MDLVRTAIQAIYRAFKNRSFVGSNDLPKDSSDTSDGINETKYRRRIQILEDDNHDVDEIDEEEVDEDDEEECSMACRDFIEYVSYQIYYNAFTDEA